MGDYPPGVYVARTACDKCLFTAERIVPGSRAAEVIRTCRTDDTFFVCHRFSIHGGPYDGHVSCRAFYDRFPEQTPFQLARRLGALHFLDQP